MELLSYLVRFLAPDRAYQGVAVFDVPRSGSQEIYFAVGERRTFEDETSRRATGVHLIGGRWLRLPVNSRSIQRIGSEMSSAYEEQQAA